jgi:ComF family protein
MGSVLDFLVEDSCVICRRPPPARSEIEPGLGPPRDFFGDPLEVRHLFGFVKLVNRPVCSCCAAEFVTARTVGALGRLVGPQSIETSCGERFGDPGDTQDSRAPSPDEGNRPVIPVISPFMTTKAVLKVVHSFKFGGNADLAHPIARCMAWAFRSLHGAPRGAAPEESILLSTPMDAAAERRRGFNHAELIAGMLSAELGIPIRPGALKKTGRNRPQSKTPKADRAANVRGVFSCPAGPVEVVGRAVFLVDDLVTTGATAASCGVALLGAGARSVTVICFARAL